MDRIKVDSSNILSIGFDEETNILEVEFHSLKVYRYLDVPLRVYCEIMEASSKGKYLAESIKGHYAFVKL